MSSVFLELASILSNIVTFSFFFDHLLNIKVKDRTSI